MSRARRGPGAPGRPSRRDATLASVDDFVARVIRRLRAEPGFSRNRHFMAFSSPEGRRALRVHRHLRSIEHDLSRGCSATVERTEEGVRVTLRAKSSVRMAWLSHDEYGILRTNPLVRSALGEAAAAHSDADDSRPAARARSACNAATGSDPT